MDGEGQSSGRRPPKYEGEDLSPTSNKELLGWYTYSLAAEVFAVCGVGSFLPITLEQLARERGVFLSDGATPCVSETTSGLDAANSTSMLARANGQPDNVCIVHLFGGTVNTASFAMYTFSIAVLVQAVVLVSCSSMADYGKNRKRLLLVFGFTGATASMFFLLIVPQIFLIGSLLVVIGVTCLGSSFVLLNSFLPVLVANHPLLTEVNPGEDEGPDSVPLQSLSPQTSTSISLRQEDTLSSGRNSTAKQSPASQLSARISSKGVGIGYAAAVFVQILSILLLLALTKSSWAVLSKTLPLRLVLFIVGLWWFVFTFISSLWLRNRPGPPLITTFSKTKRGWRSFFDYVKFAWVSLWETITIAVKLRQVVLFLAAWVLLSDAIATVSGTAILFAKTELNMPTPAVAALSILSTISGIAGAFTWPIISRRLGMRPNHTIIACIVLFEFIPIYGLMGYLPFLQRWGVGGLQQPWEIYPLGFVHGFVIGGLSSYCRSFFGLLIPPGSEAAFYALYAITDKGSSVFGPAVVGAIVDATGHIRPAFGFLAVIILLPAPLIWWIDAEQGRRDATAVVEKSVGRGDNDLDRDSLGGEGEEREGLLMDEN